MKKIIFFLFTPIIILAQSDYTLQIATEIEQKYMKGYEYFSQGNNNLACGYFEDAINMYENFSDKNTLLLTKLNGFTTKSNIIGCFQYICRSHLSEYRFSELLFFGHKMLKNSLEANDRKWIAASYNRLGTAFEMIDGDSAEYYYIKGLDYIDNVTRDVPNFYNNISNFYTYISAKADYYKAILYQEKEIDAYFKLGDELEKRDIMIINEKINLGHLKAKALIFQSENKNEKIIKKETLELNSFWNDLIQDLHEINFDDYGVDLWEKNHFYFRAYNNYALFLTENKKDYDSAISNYKISIKNLKKVDPCSYELATIYHSLAYTFKEKNSENSDSIVFYEDKIIELIKQCPKKLSTGIAAKNSIHVLQYIANNYNINGNPNRALKFANLASEMAKNYFGDVEEQTYYLYSVKYRSYMQLLEYKEALNVALELLKVDYQQVNTYTLIAKAYFYMNEFEQANLYINKSLELVEYDENLVLAVKINHELANPIKATKYLNKIIENDYDTSIQMEPNLDATILFLKSLLIENENIDLALEYYQTGWDLYYWEDNFHVSKKYVELLVQNGLLDQAGQIKSSSLDYVIKTLLNDFNAKNASSINTIVEDINFNELLYLAQNMEESFELVWNIIILKNLTNNVITSQKKKYVGIENYITAIHTEKQNIKNKINNTDSSNPEIESLYSKLQDLDFKSFNFINNIDNSTTIEYSQVQPRFKQLTYNEAIVDIIRYEYNKSTYYSAIITEHDYIDIIPLFINKEKDYLNSYQSYMTMKNKSKTDSVSYYNMWEKIEKRLTSDIVNIYVKSDGIYNFININGIYRPKYNNYVEDVLNVSYLTNTMNISKKNKLEPLNENVVLVGNPSFRKSSNTSSRSLTDSYWTELPGTKKELENIQKAFNSKDLIVYTRDDANEENVKSIISPKILHFATHGYFNKNEESQVTDKSGLVLSGANDFNLDLNKNNYTSQNQGYLTAKEILNLNLAGTDLVVLSACQTGLGDITKSTQGIDGLQQSFFIAGANNLIMSLWEVDDNATSELMSVFYDEYKKYNNISDAFKIAKRHVKNKYKHPYYWASFILLED